MSKRSSTTRPARQQRGAVAVLVGFTLVALVLMLGLVIDLGHLFVTKSELQNAADACALSAAREMNDLSTGAIDRITAAGVTVGNRNRSDLQGEDVNIQAQDVTFSDGPNGPFARTVSSSTTHVRCAPHESNPKSVVLWFMGIVGMTDRELSAYAIAGLQGGAQSQCVLPLAMCAQGGNPSQLIKGKWYNGRLAAGESNNGAYGWIRLPGQANGANGLADAIAGPGEVCNIDTSSKVDAEPGMNQSVSRAWNTRFGLYGGGNYKISDIDTYPPDRTGYSFSASWPTNSPENAYPTYVTHKNAHDPFNSADFSGKSFGAEASKTQRTDKGQDRRLAFVPIIDCAAWENNKKGMEIKGFACALLLSPINSTGSDVNLEFRGSGQNTDCATTGAPGNSGTTVPKLVK